MRLKQALAVAAVVGLVALAYAVAPAQAHHAVQAQFDVNQTVEKKGALVKIDWINPHTYMHFDVTEESGVTRYAIESLGVPACAAPASTARAASRSAARSRS